MPIGEKSQIIKNTSSEVFLGSQIIRKPGSVLASHLSRPAVANRFKRFLWFPRAGGPCCGYLLAAGRVYLSSVSPRRTVGSYPRSWRFRANSYLSKL